MCQHSYLWRRQPPPRVEERGTGPRCPERKGCWCSGSSPAWSYAPGNTGRSYHGQGQRQVGANLPTGSFLKQECSRRTRQRAVGLVPSLSCFAGREHTQVPSRLGLLVCWTTKSHWRAMRSSAGPSWPERCGWNRPLPPGSLSHLRADGKLSNHKTNNWTVNQDLFLFFAIKQELSTSPNLKLKIHITKRDKSPGVKLVFDSVIMLQFFLSFFFFGQCCNVKSEDVSLFFFPTCIWPFSHFWLP